LANLDPRFTEKLRAYFDGDLGQLDENELEAVEDYIDRYGEVAARERAEQGAPIPC